MLRTICRPTILLLPVFVLLVYGPCAWAQEETKAEEQYREDYDRFQKIKGIQDPLKRVDAWYEFLKKPPHPKMLKSVQAEYLVILDGLLRAQRYAELRPLSERFITLFPKVGETYYCYGAALKEEKKFPQAMDALAKCYVLKNPASERAKSFLEYVYKAQNKGSLAGIDAIIQKARADVLK